MFFPPCAMSLIFSGDPSSEIERRTKIIKWRFLQIWMPREVAFLGLVNELVHRKGDQPDTFSVSILGGGGLRHDDDDDDTSDEPIRLREEPV